MRKITLGAWLALTFSLMAGSCKKSSSKPAPPAWTAGIDVYIAGQDSGRAVYWKNGQEVVLATIGMATGITISGSDVYVSGYVSTSSGQNAVYWKNGVQVNLTETGTAMAYTPVLSGGNLYVPGYILGTTPPQVYPVYWKNGVRVGLDATLRGVASGLAVADTDVYVIGQVYDGPFDTALVWKNGARVNNFFSIGGGLFSQILTSGSDVYVVGLDGYYVNETTYSIMPGASGTTAMTFNGQDVYVAGEQVDSINNSNPAYWKNGVMTVLPDYKGSSANGTTGIVVAGTDVYVIGYSFLNGQNAGVYWKNGVEETLTPNGLPNGVVIGN